MNTRCALVIIVALALNARAAPAVRFVPVDVWFDTGEQSLAAYQIEVRYDATRVDIVGLEGGEHPAFTKAPYYDPRGLTGGRIVVAAFSTAKDLPAGRVRLARIHLRVAGDEAPSLQGKLLTAGSTGARKITPTLTLKEAAREVPK